MSVEVTRVRWVRRALGARTLQPALMLVMLFFLVVAIVAGVAGTAAGNHNFGVVYVWIVWWALLIMALVPFLGRAWCAVCPIPGPGEWLQRRAVIRRSAVAPRTLGWRWPARLRNIWLQTAEFLGLGLFSTVILTRADVTAWLLLAMLVAATALSVLYRHRVFCRYVCPVGGFIGLYSLLSPLALRVRDTAVCLDHRTKDCVTGNERGYGCPWMAYPGSLQRNAPCGLCTECLKTCPRDNVAVTIRPIGVDLLEARGRRLDEACKALLMLACAIVYSAVLLGPWGALKRAANMESLAGGAVHAATFLLVTAGVVPGLFWIAAASARRVAALTSPPSRLFVDYAYCVVPLGLTAWMAFTTGFVFVNGSYAVSVLSDPLGWGWDLFGTASVPWTPILVEVIAPLQVALILVGLVGSIVVAHRVGREHARDDAQAWRATLPVSAFLATAAITLLWLYLG